MFSSFLVFLWLLQIALVIFCWRRQFKLLSAYLGLSFISDLLGQIVIYLNITYYHHTKPYTGLGFILWMISSGLYLMQPTLLSYLTGYALKNKTYQMLTVITYIAMLITLFCVYPAMAGAGIIRLFSYYYLAMFTLSAISLVISNKMELGLQKLLLLACAIGGIAQWLLIHQFSIQDYFLINLGNGIFYMLIAVVVWLYPRVDRLLSR